MTRLKNLLDVLIVSGNEDRRQKLRSLLPQNTFAPAIIAENIEEAKRLLAQGGYDLVIIDTPLPYGSGIDLALDTAESSYSAVILTVNGDRFDETRYRVEDMGVMTVEKPIQPEQFNSALHLCISAHNRVLALERENTKLRQKLDEMRLVNRAKWVLCENLGMDEPSAHRYIEKKAMDNRITRLSVAKQILKE